MYHGWREDYPYASDRLHALTFGGSRDVQRGCEERGLRCVTHVDRKGTLEKGLAYRLAEQALTVLTDDQLVFVVQRQAQRFAEKCDLAVYAVDAARLVPTGVLHPVINTTQAFRKASGALRPRYEAHQSEFEAVMLRFDGDVSFTDERLTGKHDVRLQAIVAE